MLFGGFGFSLYGCMVKGLGFRNFGSRVGVHGFRVEAQGLLFRENEFIPPFVGIAINRVCSRQTSGFVDLATGQNPGYPGYIPQ